MMSYDEQQDNLTDPNKNREDPPTAWKINVTDDDSPETRTIYLSTPTKEDAETIAHLIEHLPSVRRARNLTASVHQWNPDQPDVDANEPVSLEAAILWAFGR